MDSSLIVKPILVAVLQIVVFCCAIFRVLKTVGAAISCGAMPLTRMRDKKPREVPEDRAARKDERKEDIEEVRPPEVTGKNTVSTDRANNSTGPKETTDNSTVPTGTTDNSTLPTDRVESFHAPTDTTDNSTDLTLFSSFEMIEATDIFAKPTDMATDPSTDSMKATGDSAKPMEAKDSKQAETTVSSMKPLETTFHSADPCILIIGKTGTGKSSLGNTITGGKNFAVGRGMSSTTQEANAVTVDVFGKKIKVVDTQDINNLLYSRSQKQEQVSLWKEMTSPGPNAILLTVRCDIRYTVEEKETYDEIKELWGNDPDFCQRLIVAFTFGDRQDDELEEKLTSVCPDLLSVLNDAGNRYVLFNNKASPAKKQEAVKQLIVVKQGSGGHWPHESSRAPCGDSRQRHPDTSDCSFL